MADENQKIVEKYYIEVNSSFVKRFIVGLMGGIGWGVGLTLGTGLVLYIVNAFDFIPVFGSFFTEILKSTNTQ